MADLHFLANPARFRRFSQRVLPGLTLATVLGFAVGLYLALLQSPPDYQQGETVRIMFVHVPSAWLSMAVGGRYNPTFVRSSPSCTWMSTRSPTTIRRLLFLSMTVWESP